MYRVFNAVFGKVGRMASDEVVVQLFKHKRLPILFHELEVCRFNKSQIDALRDVVTSCFGKIFCTRPRDSTQHMPKPISYWPFIGTEPLSPTVFEIFGLPTMLTNIRTHERTNHQQTRRIAIPPR